MMTCLCLQRGCLISLIGSLCPYLCAKCAKSLEARRASQILGPSQTRFCQTLTLANSMSSKKTSSPGEKLNTLSSGHASFHVSEIYKGNMELSDTKKPQVYSQSATLIYPLTCFMCLALPPLTAGYANFHVSETYKGNIQLRSRSK